MVTRVRSTRCGGPTQPVALPVREIVPVSARGSSARRATSIDELATRARALVSLGGRRILGITGPPGGGKSTLAETVALRLEGIAIRVPMDGFHLSNAELDRLGRRARKGAPDTFDAAGYVALLRRLKATEDEVVYAPEFRRELEEAVAGAIAVPGQVPLVITEGNYLLLDWPPWASIRTLLDESWYVDLQPASRVRRLTERHVRYGKAQAEAEEWVRRSDEVNARLIADARDRADVLVVDVGG
jgi:pantothenate kinase